MLAVFRAEAAVKRAPAFHRSHVEPLFYGQLGPDPVFIFLTAFPKPGLEQAVGLAGFFQENRIIFHHMPGLNEGQTYRAQALGMVQYFTAVTHHQDLPGPFHVR